MATNWYAENGRVGKLEADFQQVQLVKISLNFNSFVMNINN